MKKQIAYLSYPINPETPTYGNRLKVHLRALKSIAQNDTVNETLIELPLHAGTHIDFPRHFYENGQSFIDFPPEFWICEHVLCLTVEAGKSLVLSGEIIRSLRGIKNQDYDLILINILPRIKRNSSDYWENNYGVGPEVATFIRQYFPAVRMIGLNSISLSSYKHSKVGKEAHLEFLNTTQPILIIEDMDFSALSDETNIYRVVVAPLSVENVDGAPVTVLAEFKDEN